jgi:hypothetical protein
MRSEIENLIDLALADGEISEKEKQVLFKKAQELGIDLDEFELILNGKIQLRNKQNHQQAAPNSNKFGDVKKCPSCGAIIKAFIANCTDCGHEFSSIGSSSAMKEFRKKLEAGNDEKDIELIKSFHVPNTKEDLVEFLTLSITNYKRATSKELQLAWLSMAENIMLKINLVFKDSDPLVINFRETLKKAQKEVAKKKAIENIGIILAILVVLTLLFFLGKWILSFSFKRIFFYSLGILFLLSIFMGIFKKSN